MGILAKHIQVWNQDSLWYGVKVMQTTLQALLRSAISGVVVQGFIIQYLYGIYLKEVQSKINKARQ